jgi:hypothetical protein
MMANHSFFLKDRVLYGTNDSKDRFTILLAVSMLGEKVKPLIVGKYLKPRCFPKSDLYPDFYYSSSPNAWVMFKASERKVAIILDNCFEP